MSVVPFYELTEPTTWAAPPEVYSFSSLQAIQSCPRRWQLVHSRWGEHARFPERPQPAAIEGQIVHEALDLLARELGRHGRPPVGSPAFRAAVERCGFWTFFTSRVQEWNRRLALHPRAGPRHVLRTEPRDLANRVICLFREQYRPAVEEALGAVRVVAADAVEAEGSSHLRQLRAHGALSEVRLEHPSIPVIGVLDLVVVDDAGRTAVVDFKTGVQRKIHEEQLLLYAMLWWRVTGEQPDRIVAQYLDSSWIAAPTEADLLAAEKDVTEKIRRASDALARHPAPARTGQDCSWCPVRPRCSEGWVSCENTTRVSVGSRPIDLEVIVSSKPTSTGFLGTRPNGGEVSIVFDAAVGCGLPRATVGDRFRVIDAVQRAEGKEVEVLPWTELYRL